MSKTRTYELLDLTIKCLSEDMNRLRRNQINRNMANESLAKITSIQHALNEIYPLKIEGKNNS